MDAAFVGLRVRLQVEDTPEPYSLEGTVFTYEPRSNLLVLSALSDADVRRHSVHVLRASRVLGVVMLDDDNDDGGGSGGGGDVAPLDDPHRGKLYNPQQPLPPLDLEKLRAREERAVRAEEDEAQRKLGAGVTPLAQRIFDALDKTLPCRWRGKDIMVLDAVRVAEPYGVGDVRAVDNDERAAERVRMVLGHELQKAAGCAGGEQHAHNGERDSAGGADDAETGERGSTAVAADASSSSSSRTVST